MKKQTIAWILQSPLILLVVAAFIGGIYAAAKNIQKITAGTPIILGIILILYGVGIKYSLMTK